MRLRGRSFVPGSGWSAAALVTFVVVALTANIAFALIALVVCALAAVGLSATRGLAAQRRLGAIVAIVVVGAGLLGLAGHGLRVARTPVRLPPFAVTLPSDPTADQAATATALVDQLPDRATSWVLVGDTGDATTPVSPAYLGYERALLLDPKQTHAALGLSRLYLARDQSLLDTELADFYTRLAGFRSPPLRPAS